MRLFSAFISLSCAVLLSACIVNNPNPGERKSDSYWARGDYADAIKIIQPRAELGDPWAQLRMGFYYDAGHGVPIDLRQAVHWYTKVAAQMAEGDWADGSLILTGERGQEGHFGKRKDALIAQWRLANIYYDGKVVGRDLTKAYVLINQVSKATQGENIYFCCSHSTIPALPGDRGRHGSVSTERHTKGRWVTAKMIARTLSKVESAITSEERMEAMKILESQSSEETR